MEMPSVQMVTFIWRKRVDRVPREQFAWSLAPDRRSNLFPCYSLEDGQEFNK